MNKLRQFHLKNEGEEMMLVRSILISLLSGTHLLVVQEFDEKMSKLVDNVVQYCGRVYPIRSLLKKIKCHSDELVFKSDIDQFICSKSFENQSKSGGHTIIFLQDIHVLSQASQQYLTEILLNLAPPNDSVPMTSIIGFSLSNLDNFDDNFMDQFMISYWVPTPIKRVKITGFNLSDKDLEQVTVETTTVSLHHDIELLIRNIEMAFRHDKRIKKGNSSPSLYSYFLLYAKSDMLLQNKAFLDPDHILSLTDNLMLHRIKPYPSVGLQTKRLIKSILKTIDIPR